ncbi:MAG: hypothetical protein LIO67_10165 [Lachnospiraceae bacterium]|nr:hypothetical protein [Lachnospiraceae bacterium]
MYSLLSNAVSSLTGNITKAILFVCDESVTSVETAQENADTLREKILKNTSSALSLGSQTFSSITANNLTAGTNYWALEVQYNPSSLSISTQGAGEMVDYGARDSVRLARTTQNFEQALSMLHCQLLFDDTNIGNAFVQGNFSLTPGNVISTGSRLINALRSNPYTVQPQMDAIMSLLLSDATRQVMFVWGSMCFRGELTSVDNTYTMFNKSGNPIRGTIDITIRQEKASPGDMDYWEDAYKDKFESTSVLGKTSLASKITNNSLLNLSL